MSTGSDRASTAPVEGAAPAVPSVPTTPAGASGGDAGSGERTGPAAPPTDAPNAPPTINAPIASTAPADEAAAPAGPHGKEQPARDKLSARLRRNPDGKMIAGVCTGMGDAWGIDPVLARLLFVAVGVIFFPIGPLAYVVFWMLMPEKD
jgi:phage shock protein PspC (stress-responsive transcriptional regulator)